ncbi:MAG: hypothetical protein FWF97_04610 [Alphaproteobacteria bacterium]|nr:hypothetical protein [Alphaproteobacteria bacterium]
MGTKIPTTFESKPYSSITEAYQVYITNCIANHSVPVSAGTFKSRYLPSNQTPRIRQEKTILPNIEDTKPRFENCNLQNVKSAHQIFKAICDSGGIRDESQAALFKVCMEILDEYDFSETEQNEPTAMRPSKMNFEAAIKIKAALEMKELDDAEEKLLKAALLEIERYESAKSR